MLSKLYSYLTYREKYTIWNGVKTIELRYYSIGACLLTVGIVAIVVVAIAATIVSYEPQDVVHPVTVVAKEHNERS